MATRGSTVPAGMVLEPRGAAGATLGPAACTGLFHLFFSEHQEDIDLAKEVCRSCVRRSSCLRAALERRETCGVWGGELLRDGMILRELPRRGRPPSSAA